MTNGEVIPIGATPSLEEMDKEIKKAEVEAKKEKVKVIESLDNFSFFSWGYSEPLKITRGNERTRVNEIEYVQFKIKSIGVTEVMEELQAKAPTPPAKAVTHKRGSDIAQQLGVKHDVLVWEVNEADENYIKDRQKYNTIFSQKVLLHGLAYDLKVGSELVLEGANINSPSKIHNEEAALRALRAMGLSSEHYTIMVRSIRELTAEKEQAENLA